ncbi:uncharacterized protein EKO05_0002889 [Ascochyta rabiei]|uniref:uncharacterized protein n=1 Tax=Didymella rabiei TaxID=5454 RepID=UPI0021FDD4E2|nr:uncharacterized protein EKO05_0002889 [Ascochyta rabiei]UPX12335.1 hypothetical protein EKO05_0002889 [Ascochyta rabiei]
MGVVQGSIPCKSISFCSSDTSLSSVARKHAQCWSRIFPFLLPSLVAPDSNSTGENSLPLVKSPISVKSYG